MTDKQKIRTNMTANQVNIDRCICNIDLAASGREDCEKIRKHIRAIRRIFAGLPEEPTKFDIGDTIRPKGSKAEYTITSISGGCYHGNGWGLPIDAEKDYELVEPKTAGVLPNSQHTRTDAFIEKAANFLRYKLYDRVEVRVPGKATESIMGKPEFIEEFINEMTLCLPVDSVDTQIKSQNEAIKQLNSALNSMENGGDLPLVEDNMISDKYIYGKEPKIVETGTVTYL